MERRRELIEWLDTGQAELYEVEGSDVALRLQMVICLNRPANNPSIQLLAELCEQRNCCDSDQVSPSLLISLCLAACGLAHSGLYQFKRNCPPSIA